MCLMAQMKASYMVIKNWVLICEKIHIYGKVFKKTMFSVTWKSSKLKCVQCGGKIQCRPDFEIKRRLQCARCETSFLEQRNFPTLLLSPGFECAAYTLGIPVMGSYSYRYFIYSFSGSTLCGMWPERRSKPAFQFLS